jgi:phosphatidylinositol glycan class B
MGLKHRRAISGAQTATTDDSAWLRRMLLPALALMLASAWWCTGFIQADEHFQVLEFASARLGLSRIGDLPWEYAARARSWLLPAIAAALRRGMIAVGHDDPFVCAFLLRAASGALYLAAVWRFARATTRWFRARAAWRAAVVMGLFLWFVPLVAARFSAESWSGSLFFLGFATLVRVTDGEECSTSELVLAGLALGFAYVARFQVLLLEAGAIVWMIRAGGVPRSAWALLFAGAIGACAVGAGIDAWGYGAPAFTLWNYFVVNFPGGALLQYVPQPWWWYGRALIYATGWPVGIALIAGFAGLCVRRQVHPLAWTLVPFLVFHLLIPTKEIRFIFPMLVAAPYVIVLGLERWWPAAFVTRHAVAMRVVAALLVAANATAFVLRLWMPMEPRIAVQEVVYRSGADTVIIVGGRDPYVWWNLRSNWYRPAGLRVINAKDLSDARRLAASSPGALLITRAPETPDAGTGSCRVVHESIPAQLSESWRRVLDHFMPERESEAGWWYVARCDRT